MLSTSTLIFGFSLICSSRVSSLGVEFEILFVFSGSNIFSFEIMFSLTLVSIGCLVSTLGASASSFLSLDNISLNKSLVSSSLVLGSVAKTFGIFFSSCLGISSFISCLGTSCFTIFSSCLFLSSILEILAFVNSSNISEGKTFALSCFSSLG